MDKKKILDRAPLVHAVIHLRFSDIPSLSNIATEQIDKIHSRMIQEEFPEKIESKGETIEVKFDQKTQQLAHRHQPINRYLFRAAGEKKILEISKNSIILKATEYRTFQDFYSTFDQLLNGCIEAIDNLDKVLLKSVGLRYVNILVPNSGAELKDFVSGDVLPMPLGMIEGAKHLHGLSTKAVETEHGKVLSVTLEELPVVNGSVTKVLPDNLIEPDDKCGLQISGQSSWAKVNSQTYGILDVDHSHEFIGSPNFSVNDVEVAIHKLYEQANSVFWGVISEHAKTEWGYREKDCVE